MGFISESAPRCLSHIYLLWEGRREGGGGREGGEGEKGKVLRERGREGIRRVKL